MTIRSFAYDITVPAEKIVSAVLGPNTSTKFTDNDVGKAVKIGALGTNVVQCADGDEIYGFVNTVEPSTYNGGYSFGGVIIEGRVYATVAANQGGTAMKPGDYVVAGTPVALNTAGIATVKTGTPVHQHWQVLRIITGTGVAGDTVLLERC